MYTYRPGIDVKPSWVSIRRAFIAALLGMGFSILVPALWLGGLIPDLIFNSTLFPVYAVVATLSSICVWKLWLILRAMRRDFLNQGASRAFTYAGSHLPLMLSPGRSGSLLERVIAGKRLTGKTWWPFPWNDAEARVDDRVARKVKAPEPAHGKRWTIEWIPYDTEYVSFTGADGQPYHYTKKVLYGEHAPVFAAIKPWLIEHHPDRWKIVERWWLSHWIQPELIARFGKDYKSVAKKEDLAAVAKAHEVELLQGCRVAADQTWWRKRIGFGYEFLYFPNLQRQLREAVVPAPKATKDAPPMPALPTAAQATEFCMGKGFKWDTRHTQKFENIKMRDLSEVTDSPLDFGDPRPYGLGLKEERFIFAKFKTINQHAGIFGSTGVGKTRYVEPIIVQVIRAGYPLIVIDPKGDADLTDRFYEEGRRCGRGHHLRYFSLVLPKNPNICTANPLNHYKDETFLGQRVGSVVPNTKDPFWRDKAIQIAREILTMAHWIREYLQFLDRNQSTRKKPPRNSVRIPRVLLAMQYAANDPAADPVTADAAVDAIIEGMEQPGWIPDAKQTPVVKLLQMTHFTPCEWNPTIRVVSYWGIEKTPQFFGWMLKIFGFHLYLDNTETAQPNFVDLVSDNVITSKGSLQGKSYPSMWMAYKNGGLHPLEALVNENAILNQDVKRWFEFYRYFLGDLSKEDHEYVREILNRVQLQFDTIYAMVSIEREKFLEQISTLMSSLSRFKGSRERIIAAQDPDLTWSRVVDEQLLVYCALGALVDADGASGIAKMLVQDIASYIGEVYSFKENSKPFFLICDEVASFINEPMIDLLNKGRGAGAHCILIGQSIADLAAVLQDENKAQQVLTNLVTKIHLRAGLPKDAEEYSKLGGHVNVEQRSRSISVTPAVSGSGNQNIQSFSANANWSRQLKEVPKIPPSCLLNLPRGQAFLHMDAEVYFLAVGLLPKPSVNLKVEFHMIEEEEGKRRMLFEALPDGSSVLERPADSLRSLYRPMRNTAVEDDDEQEDDHQPPVQQGRPSEQQTDHATDSGTGTNQGSASGTGTGTGSGTGTSPGKTPTGFAEGRPSGGVMRLPNQGRETNEMLGGDGELS